MRIDASIAQRLVDRWNREETRETVAAMSREIVSAARNGKFGHGDVNVQFGYSLAASVKDPIFLSKVAEVAKLRRFNVSSMGRLVDRWDREETQEMVSAISRELVNATENGEFGRSNAGVQFGYSLAASVKDPIFLEKVAALLTWRFQAL